jgi:hypothetical protein
MAHTGGKHLRRYVRSRWELTLTALALEKRLLIARPRPMPPYLLAMAEEAWENFLTMTVLDALWIERNINFA